MNKYIVRNCPALRWDRRTFMNCYDRCSKIKCEDISDCPLKQIINKCKNIKGYDPLAKYILNLLEIGEVNEM